MWLRIKERKNPYGFPHVLYIVCLLSLSRTVSSALYDLGLHIQILPIYKSIQMSPLLEILANLFLHWGKFNHSYMNAPRKLLEPLTGSCHFLLCVGNCFSLLLDCVQVEGNSAFTEYFTPSLCHANSKF